MACGNGNLGLWIPDFSSWNPELRLRLESVIQVPLTRNPKSSSWKPESTAWDPESDTVVDYLTCMKGAVPFLAKFVLSRCAFCKLRRNFAFSVPSIILADLLGNTCLLALVQKVMDCDS